MFGKRPGELVSEDIRRVISEQVQEGSETELKGTLPAKKGTVDPWVSGEGRVGDYARNELVEEVIAFANGYGGWLLLGIEETEDRPKRAKAVAPIRACADLADRLRLMCRDCIEPKLSVFDVEGVVMQDDGAGIVAFHVPKSRMAPHRHTVTKECYVRRADRTEKMTMREIQDLTLQVERGMEAIERRFRERQELFAEMWEHFIAGAPKAVAMRATLVPLTPLYVERVHNNGSVRPPAHPIWATENGREPFQMTAPIMGAWRPLVRGTVCVNTHHLYDYRQAVFCDGLVEYSMLDGAQEWIELGLSPVMVRAANALLAAERFRRAAGAPSVEYALEIETRTHGGEVAIGGYGSGPCLRRLGAWSSPREVFPRYVVGPPEEFRELTSLVERDFGNAAGVDWGESPIRLDFDRASRELGMFAEGAGP